MYVVKLGGKSIHKTFYYMNIWYFMVQLTTDKMYPHIFLAQVIVLQKLNLGIMHVNIVFNFHKQWFIVRELNLGFMSVNICCFQDQLQGKVSH